MSNSPLDQRLRFLAQASQLLAVESPQLSAHLGCTLDQTLEGHCACGTLRLGWNTNVTVARKLKQTKVQYSCLVCSRYQTLPVHDPKPSKTVPEAGPASKNERAKKRSKSRKSGLQDMLRNKTATKPGLDLSDFLMGP